MNNQESINRPRAREAGIILGTMTPGPANAITDVAGVRVGHVTIMRGTGKLVRGVGPVRTGVTAILPHDGDLFAAKVPAAAVVFNGFGKTIGLVQIAELGQLETPILLTNTLNVGRVADALVAYMLEQPPLHIDWFAQNSFPSFPQDVINLRQDLICIASTSP